MTAFTPECLREVGRIRTAVERRIRNGETPSGAYADELRRWSALPQTKSLLPPYYRLQVCCIFQMQDDGCLLSETSAAFEILDEWKSELIRNGLTANVEIPDNARMIKLFSRRTRFALKGWGNQGHRHKTDGLSLPGRICAVHKYLEDET